MYLEISMVWPRGSTLDISGCLCMMGLSSVNCALARMHVCMWAGGGEEYDSAHLCLLMFYWQNFLATEREWALGSSP